MAGNRKDKGKLFKLFNRENFWDFFRREVLQAGDHTLTFAISVGTGIFIGMSPFWGWHTLLAVGAAVIFRLNKVITVTASYISIPPLIPFILFFSYRFGGLILANKWEGLETDEITREFVKTNIIQYIVGAFALGASCGLTGGIISYFIVLITRKRNGRENGIADYQQIGGGNR